MQFECVDYKQKELTINHISVRQAGMAAHRAVTFGYSRPLDRQS